ncbi:uncharacterized protein PRCAT00002458001 [Priceomyces carsonii]|uniref:uncharacterized protein n=1 Tax=Priceomyces carsonii TaxID=28549 RepID=UPI002ED9885A|nr:unnamed protein product [Priceomyces carsonii]
MSMSETGSKMSKRRFICEDPKCLKSFTRRDYLIRHEANHSKVRPYHCILCKVRFARKDLLRKHTSSHSHLKKQEAHSNHHKELVIMNFTPNPSSGSKSTDLRELSEQKYCSEEAITEPHYELGNKDDTSSPTGNNSEIKSKNLDLNINPQNCERKPSPDFSERSSSISSNHNVIDNETYSSISNILKDIGIEQIYSLESVNNFLALFWLKFITTYPIIHYHTFEANNSDPKLLLTMISLGMAYTEDKHDYHFSKMIHRNLKNLLFKDVVDRADVKISTLQAILLDNYYCKLLGDTAQFRISELFHGTGINLLRYSGYLDNLVGQPLKDFRQLSSLEQSRQWKEWIDYESSKRTAFFGFLIDVQNTSLFGYRQLLSAFEMQLELPCSDAVWNAANPICFYKEYMKQPKEMSQKYGEGYDPNNGTIPMPEIKIEGNWPSFLWSLRRLMQPYRKHHKEYTMNCFSQFSRLILLHGVLSVVSDLKWRNLIDLRFLSKKKLSDLSKRLMVALLNWRGYFHNQICFTNESLGKLFDDSVLNDYRASNIFWANLTLFQFAVVALHVDTVCVVRLATEFVFHTSSLEGTSRRNTKSYESDRNLEEIEQWTRSADGKLAVEQSSKILNTVINNPEIISYLPHTPWTIYIATLTVWCFETYQDAPCGCSNKNFSHQISASKYSMPFEDEFDYTLAQNDAMSYLARNLEDKEDNIEEPEGVEVEQKYWRNRQQALGIVVFVMLFMKNCQWGNTDTLRRKLYLLVKSHK